MAVATTVVPVPAVAELSAQTTPAQIKSRVFARIGLLGNPSDGYHGKTISFALANFYAEVSIWSAHCDSCAAGLMLSTAKNQQHGTLY
jgi:hypothetical protein